MPRFVLAPFLRHALLFLFQPGRVAALVGNALATIEFQRPFRNIVEKIAIMSDERDHARIVAQETLQPGDGFGIQMVGRLIEQQNFRLGEQQAAERHAPQLTTGKRVHLGITRRTAQRIHGLFDLLIQIPQILSINLILQRRHLVRGVIGIVDGQLVIAVEYRFFFRDTLHHIADDVLFRVKNGLLR
ncbi:hypothetical protein MnTg02_00267 [bacterium MnTg02]|nr:hypothetical protein MnTg02_00267 [bacterium MnTg02]